MRRIRRRLATTELDHGLAFFIFISLRLPERYSITLALVGLFDMLLMLFVPSFFLNKFHTSPLIFFPTLFSIFMLVIVIRCMGSSFLIAFLVGPLYYFPRYLPPPNKPIWQICTTGGNGMNRD